MAEQETTRREVIQRAVYVAPAILTLVAIPTFASAGSGAESRHRGERLRELMEQLRGEDPLHRRQHGDGERPRELLERLRERRH
jgi:hypothetical protein